MFDNETGMLKRLLIRKPFKNGYEIGDDLKEID